MFSVFRSSSIESNYSVSTNPLFVSDPWTVYPAKHKVSKKNCSVFSFSKKDFESSMVRQGLLDKSNKAAFLSDCYKTLERYITNLSRFKHPNILTVLEPLEDHKSRMLFVTEYVTSDLTNFPKHELDDLVISYGLSQVAEGLKFLHHNANMVHLNIQPSSVFINENFDWKLSGFSFEKPESTEEYFVDRPDARLPQFLGVNLCYTSPGVVLSHRLDYNSDMFSFGCLIYYLFNARADSSPETLLSYEGNSLASYERSFNKLKTAINGQKTVPGVQTLFRNIPQKYLETFVRLISLYDPANYTYNTSEYLTIEDELIESRIFQNDTIRLLNSISQLRTASLSSRVAILNDLKEHINTYPKSLILNKILPALTDVLLEYVPGSSKEKARQINDHDEQVISGLLDNLLLLSKTLSKLTFSDKVFTYLPGLVNLNLASCNIALINNLPLIQDRLGLRASDSGKQTEQFAVFLLHLFEKAAVPRETKSLLQLQELSLLNLPLFVQFQSYLTIKNKIFPIVCDIFSKTASLKIKNLSIKSFIMLIGDGKPTDTDNNHLDNYLIMEKLLPLIQKTSVKNFKNPEILSNMVSLYHHIFLTFSSSLRNVNTERTGATVLDTIMDPVLFELWKLSKFVQSKKNLDEVLNVIKSVETFLIERSTKTVIKKESNSTTMRSSTRSNEIEEDEEFGDFGMAVTSQDTPTFTSQPIMTSSTYETVQHPMPPAQPMQSKTITLAPTKTSTTLGFGATSANNNSTPKIQSMVPMKQTHIQPKTVQPVSIDWSRATSHSPQPTQSFAPMSPQPSQLPAQPFFPPTNVMKPMVMQPTKRVNSPNPNPAHHNTDTSNAKPSLFESLV